jgi:hypothetical protein
MIPKGAQMQVGGTLLADTTYQPGDVDRANQRFVKILEELCDVVARQPDGLAPLDDATCRDFRRRLVEVGNEAYSMLPDGVGDFLTAYERREGGHGISLSFTFPAEMAFVWEMMYAADPDDPPAWDAFWGFRYPTGHLYWNTLPSPTVNAGGGIFASSHADLAHSAREIDQLEHKLGALKQRFGVEVGLERLETSLGRKAPQDWNVLADFGDPDFRFGVVHFACHCASSAAEGALEAYLVLTAHEREIEMRAGQFLGRKKKGFRHSPLVFLNACASGTPLHLLQSFKLPETLVRFGAGGVIATACPVPDNFAGAFAAEFYDQLLLRCQQIDEFPTYVGDALLATRLHFLRAHNNPLGLAYGLYAMSNQRLDLRP